MYEEYKKLTLKELFELYKTTKDIGIRDYLVDKYSYIVSNYAKEKCNDYIEYEDLYQEGICELISVVTRNLENGFNNYSYVSVHTNTKNAIDKYIKNYYKENDDLYSCNSDYLIFNKYDELFKDFYLSIFREEVFKKLNELCNSSYKLQPRKVEMLYLWAFHKRSYDEIANMYGVSRNVVATSISKVMRIIRLKHEDFKSYLECC